MKRIGIFLDRDGTINEEVDFLSSPDDLKVIPGSAAAIRDANHLGLKVIVITNQSGIARGLLTEAQLHSVHAKLIEELKNQGEAFVDGIYYCPHHPTVGSGKYRNECECRKPRPGMLLQAAKEHGIDTSRSFLVGDRMIDIQAGRAVGATCVLVLTGYGTEELKLCRQNNVIIDYVANDLGDAMQFITTKVQHD